MQEWHNRIGDMLAYVNDKLVPHGFDERIAETMITSFHDEYRSTLGRTLSDRVNTFLDKLPSNERFELARGLAAKTADPRVRTAIEAQATVGSFYQGTAQVIANDLVRSGVPARKIAVQCDAIILAATKSYLLSLHPVLIQTIWEDIARGFVSADNARIALAPFSENWSGAVDKLKHPATWTHLEALPSLGILEATTVLDAAARDPYVNLGRQLPLGLVIVCIIIPGVAASVINRKLPREVLVGWSALAVGILSFAICMAGVFYLERYALPLLATTVFGLLTSLASLRTSGVE